MEAGRAQLYERATLTPAERVFRRIAFGELLPHKWRLRVLFGVLLAYQRSGLQRIVRALKILPGPLAQAESVLPQLPAPFLPRFEVYPARGRVRYRVGLFTGCVMPLVYGPVHWATLRVLQRNGCEVHVTREQVCCGALNVHGGERSVAANLAQRNLRAFLGRGLDAIVVNSAGCGATMKEYAHLVDSAEAAEFGRLTRDISEFLASIDLAPFQTPVNRKITLQESCHLTHAQRIRAAPRNLLAAIPGLQLTEMEHPDQCCGSAGLYMLTEPEMASRILDAKMADIGSTRATTIVTANPGCMMQLDRGARRAGIRADIRHVVELIDEAYGGVPATSS
jgi:glycolate oxidase iron-sulfur subunit